jgi:hypothetical protein
LSGIHYRHTIGHLRYDPEIVGDQQDRHPGLALQLAQ